MRRILLIAIFILFNISLYGQIDRSQYYSYGNSIYSEIHKLPHDDSDSIKVLCLFKTTVEALLFEKVNEGPNFGSYKSVFSVDVVFKSKNGIIKKRVNFKDTLLFDSYDKTTRKDFFIEGGEIVMLENKYYDVDVKFDIKEKSYLNKQEYKIEKRNDDFYAQIYFKDIEEDKRRDLLPFLFSNKIDFSSNGLRILIPYSDKLQSDDLSYEFMKSKNLPNNNIYWDEDIKFSGRVNIIENSSLKLNNYKSRVSLDVTDSDYSNLLSISIPKEKITPGLYSVILSGDGSSLDTFDLKVEWVDKPLSLNDLDYATELLYYITTDEQYERIDEAEGEQKSKLFMEFWTQYDPTPQTPFNEALEQYYKRVDYAFFNYQTISAKDGAQTDRGKVYILNSNPTSIAEEFKDGKNMIIWKYDKLKKEYIFELKGTGDFRLVKVNEIET